MQDRTSLKDSGRTRSHADVLFQPTSKGVWGEQVAFSAPPCLYFWSAGVLRGEMVKGLWPTMLVGVVGAAIAQVIQIATAFKANKRPSRRELFGSLLLAFLGAGAVLFGYGSRSLLEAATLGAAFPLLFGSAVNGLTIQPSAKHEVLGKPGVAGHRTLVDWIAGRV